MLCLTEIYTLYEFDKHIGMTDVKSKQNNTPITHFWLVTITVHHRTCFVEYGTTTFRTTVFVV